MDKTGSVVFMGVVETAGDISTIQIYPEYCSALLGLENFSHLLVIYWFHERDNQKHRKVLQVTPPRHKGAPLSGVFASRSPSRPNPIGLTVTEIVAIDGCHIKVRGLDALLGSPILDLKPYLPNSDSIPNAKVPSYYMKNNHLHN